jgi:hypothetical protein
LAKSPSTTSKTRKRATSKTTHWGGKRPDPENYFGFVYEITNNLNGRKYIGRKVYWTKNTPRKIVVKDMTNPGWCPDHWKESDWKRYISSSKDLKADIYEHGMENFTFKILHQWKSSTALRYMECKVQWQRKVLESTAYYNNWIEEFKGPAPGEVLGEENNLTGRHHLECK